MGYNEGDMLGDCPECGAADSVLYKGNGEAFCKECGVVFEVEDEAAEAAPEAPQPAPAPAPPAPQPAQEMAQPHVPNVVDPTAPGNFEVDTPFATTPTSLPTPGAIGDHDPPLGPVEVKVMGPPDSASVPSPVVNPGAQLDGSFLDEPEIDLPDYMKASRAWRWAHELGHKGNPFSGQSNSFKIYQTVVAQPCTVGQIPGLLEQRYPEICERPNFLMAVYEVLSQCLTAGLLVMDPGTRMVTECQGKPQPTKI